MNIKICGIKELMEYLNMSESGIRELIRRKEIPFFRVGNRIKFDLVEINKWIEEKKEEEQVNYLF